MQKKLRIPNSSVAKRPKSGPAGKEQAGNESGRKVSNASGEQVGGCSCCILTGTGIAHSRRVVAGCPLHGNRPQGKEASQDKLSGNLSLGGQVNIFKWDKKEVRGKLIAVDLDGTLSTGRFWEGEPTPKREMIDKVWEWYRKGAHIIINTAREPRHYMITHAWLIKHDVPFHGICMAKKPSADYYIDDRNCEPDDIPS